MRNIKKKKNEKILKAVGKRIDITKIAHKAQKWGKFKAKEQSNDKGHLNRESRL